MHTFHSICSLKKKISFSVSSLLDLKEKNDFSGKKYFLTNPDSQNKWQPVLFLSNNKSSYFINISSWLPYKKRSMLLSHVHIHSFTH